MVLKHLRKKAADEAKGDKVAATAEACLDEPEDSEDSPPEESDLLAFLPDVNELGEITPALLPLCCPRFLFDTEEGQQEFGDRRMQLETN